MGRHNIYIRNELEDFYDSMDNKSEHINAYIFTKLLEWEARHGKKFEPGDK